MNGGFEFSIEDRHPLAILHLSGSIATMGVYKIKALADNSIRSGSKYFILDLTGVSFLDSAGVGLLLQVRNGCHTAGGAVVIVNSRTSQVVQTLKISSLKGLIPFFESMGDALEYAHTKFGIVLPETSGPLAPGELAELVRSLGSRLANVEERLAKLEAREGNQT